MISKVDVLEYEKKSGKALELRRQFNRQLIAGGTKITNQSVFAALEDFHKKMVGDDHWKNTRINAVTNTTKFESGQKNTVTHKGTFSGQLGFVRNWSDPYACFSRLSRKKEGRKLATLLGKFIQQKHPQFKFTSICVNRNWPGTLHVDRNNVGPSMMLTVGSENFKGGDLYVHNLKGGGKNLKTRNRFVSFDGNDAHMTHPYSGTRYSMVFYTIQRQIHPQRRKELKKLYFNPPRSVKMGVKREKRKVRLNGAIEDMKQHHPRLYRVYQKRQGGVGEERKDAYRKALYKSKGFKDGIVPHFNKKKKVYRTWLSTEERNAQLSAALAKTKKL